MDRSRGSVISTLSTLSTVCLCLVVCVFNWVHYRILARTYSGQDLLSLTITSDYHGFHDIPDDIARTPESQRMAVPGDKPKRNRK